jgi:hypothetical protein
MTLTVGRCADRIRFDARNRLGFWRLDRLDVRRPADVRKADPEERA